MEKEKSIGLEIKILSNMIRRNIHAERTEEEIEIVKELRGTPGWIIGYIFEKSKEKDIFQKDIEKELNIRRSTATGMLQLLEKKGYIERVAVAYDARLKKLILTEKAIELHNYVMRHIKETEEKLRQGLSEGELMFFFEIMEKIKKNMES